MRNRLSKILILAKVDRLKGKTKLKNRKSKKLDLSWTRKNFCNSTLSRFSSLWLAIEEAEDRKEEVDSSLLQGTNQNESK